MAKKSPAKKSSKKAASEFDIQKAFATAFLVLLTEASEAGLTLDDLIEQTSEQAGEVADLDVDDEDDEEDEEDDEDDEDFDEDED